MSSIFVHLCRLVGGVVSKDKSRNLILLLLILAVTLALRVYQPLLLPIFHDEGLHLARAERVYETGRLVMDTEGWKYLQPWLLSLVWSLAENHLLLARLFSAVIGVLASLGVYVLTRTLYGQERVALLAAALYAVCPYQLFFDRMALADGLLTGLVVWSVWVSLLVVRQHKWWLSLCLGGLLGMTVLTKLNGAIYFALPLLTLVLDQPRREWMRRFPHLVLAWLVALPGLLPSMLDAGLRLDTLLSRSWVNSQKKGIPHLTRLRYNVSVIGSAVWHYVGPAVALLALGGMLNGVRRRNRGSLLVAASALLTILFLFLTAGYQKFYPRYLLPAFPFLLILAARGIQELARWITQRARWGSGAAPVAALIAFGVLASLTGVLFDFHLLTSPINANWMAIDRWQYIDGWPAGYGVVDAAAFLRQRAAEEGPIMVVKRADGIMRAGAWSFYLDQPEILLNALNYKHEDPEELLQQVMEAPLPIYVALDLPFEDRHLENYIEGVFAPYSQLAGTFPRPGNASRIEVYRVSATAPPSR
jgi:4-amino-4-deoxy-L-arabinose transferase-like glycosyltransferase